MLYSTYEYLKKLAETSQIGNYFSIFFLPYYIFLYSTIFMYMEYRKHINIRITQDQFLRLMKTVEQQESSLSELVRKVIDGYEQQKTDDKK